MAQRLVPEAWNGAADWAGSQKRSLYHVFFSLLPLVRDAHHASNSDLLLRGYAFADWCARHPSKGIWNAASVAFYEHVLDAGAPEEVAPWLTAEIYADVKELLAARLGNTAALRLDHAMQARQENHGPALAGLIKQVEAEQDCPPSAPSARGDG
jgi:hypothetical protein